MNYSHTISSSRRNNPLVRPGEKNSEKLSLAIRHYQKGEYRKTLTFSNRIYAEDACNVDNLLLLAATHFQLQNIVVSTFYCRQCIVVDSSCAEALNILGICHKQQGDLNEAIDFFLKATKVNSRLTEAYSNLAMTYLELDFVNESYSTLEVALTLDSTNVEVLSNIGLVCKANERYGKAKEYLLWALRLCPTFSIAWSNLGVVYYDGHDYKRAEECFSKAINTASGKKFYDAGVNLANAIFQRSLIEKNNSICKRSINLLHKHMKLNLASANLGVVYSQSAETRTFASSMLRRHVHERSGKVHRLNNLGIYYLEEGDKVNAIKYFVKVVTIKPSFADAWNNLGCALVDQGNFVDAFLCFCNANKYKSNFDEAILNLSLALMRMGCSSSALCCFNIFETNTTSFVLTKQDDRFRLGIGHVLAANDMHDKALKNFTDSLSDGSCSAKFLQNIGMTFVEVHKYIEGVACFEEYFRISSSNQSPAVMLGLIYSAAMVCDWKLVETIKPQILSFIACNVGDTDKRSPKLYHSLLSNMILDLHHLLLFTNSYSQYFPLFKLIKPLKDIHYPVRIGYISSCFGNHPMGHLVSGIFKFHNREKFLVYCYSLSSDDSSIWYNFVKTSSDHFYELPNDSFQAITQITRDRIDILVDLTSDYDVTIKSIFNLPIAPIKIIFAGAYDFCSCLTSQYIIGDKICLPESSRSNLDNIPNIINMPSSSIMNHHIYSANERDYQDNELERSDFGMDDDAFVFGFCHSSYQLSNEVYEAMLNILSKTPTSLLWFTSVTATEVESKLLDQASLYGINPKRIVVSEPTTYQTQVKRFDLMDLVLDFGGCPEIGCDALRSGRPMVSLRGNTAKERIGASLLHAVGLNSLVVESIEDLILLAVSLANCDSKYIEVVKKLEHIRHNCDLFDSEKWVQDYESGILQIIGSGK